MCTRGRLPCALECKKSVQLDITRCNLPGCIDSDLFEEPRSTNDPKLANLKLDIVACKYLGRTKIDFLVRSEWCNALVRQD